MGVEVMQDEADKKRFDPLGIRNKEPGKHYRWARKTDMRVGLHKFRGFVPSERREGGVEAIAAGNTVMKKGLDADTTISVGDLMLMETSVDNHARLEKEVDDRNKKMKRTVATDFKRQVRRATGEDLGYEDHSETKKGR